MQLYVGFPAAAGEPPKVLRAFRKVQLDPGQRATVTLTLDRRDLSVWGGHGLGEPGRALPADGRQLLARHPVDRHALEPRRLT